MIYFARTKESDFVKIGFALDDVEKRVKSFQTGCPEELSVIHVEIGDRKREAEFHRLFRESHYRGEWFHLKPDVEEYLFGVELMGDYIRKAIKTQRDTRDRDSFQEEMIEKYEKDQEEMWEREEEERCECYAEGKERRARTE